MQIAQIEVTGSNGECEESRLIEVSKTKWECTRQEAPYRARGWRVYGGSWEKAQG
jgi:hypothetical protein